jgi:outer membrane autotransporter protein
VGVARTTASESFVNRMNACPDNGDAAMDMHQRDCVWGRVSDQASTGDGSDGDSYHLNEHVVQMGGQHEFADGWWVGGSMAYNNGSESASSGVGGVTDHGFSVGAVVKREWGPWLFTGAVDVGQGSYDSNRNLQLADQRVQATGSFDANNIGMHSRIAYLFSGANWYVKPYVDLHAVNVHTDSFEETNVGAIGFKVGAGNGTVFSATPMIEAGGRINFSNGAELRPSIGVGEAIYSGNHWDTNLQLIGGASNVSPFNSEFNAPDHMNQYNAGLDLKINAHSELRLDYTGQFGNGYRMNEGSLRYTYFF